MDIFTTQLTRVVPVPIKPASLKVKALLKEAPNSKLTKDPNHLENHDHYFKEETDQDHDSAPNEKQLNHQQEAKEQPSEEEQNIDTLGTREIIEELIVGHDQIINKDEGDLTDNKNSSKHLDLYA